MNAYIYHSDVGIEVLYFKGGSDGVGTSPEAIYYPVASFVYIGMSSYVEDGFHLSPLPVESGLQQFRV